MDNTTLNSTSGGDVIRTLDKTGDGTPKTEVVALDVAGGDGRGENILTFPIPTSLDLPVDDDGVPTFSLSPSSMDALEVLFRQTMAAVGYPLTLAEAAVGVTPINLAYPPGNVLRYGADPTGIANSADAFLAARKVATQGNVELLIPGGTYKSGTTLVWGFNALRIRATGKVTITFTNAGQCITLDGNPIAPDGINGVKIEGYIKAIGNAATTDAWFIRACHRCDLTLRAGDCTTAFRFQFCVSATFYLVCTVNEAAFSARTPTTGIVLDLRNSGEYVSDCTFNQMTIEGITGTGLVLSASGAVDNIFVNGTSEGNPIGVSIASGCNGNTFFGTDFEANTTQDVLITGGSHNTFVNINSLSNVGVQPNIDLQGGDNTIFIGCFLRWVNIGASTNATLFLGSQLSNAGGVGIQGTGPYRSLGSTLVNSSNVVTGPLNDAIGPIGALLGLNCTSSSYTAANREVLAINGVTDGIIDLQVNTAIAARLYYTASMVQLLHSTGDVQIAPGNNVTLLCKSTGDFIGRGIAVCLRATSIETRASTTTLTNSTQLTYAIPSAGTYQFEIVLFSYFTTAVTNGITANVNYSGTFTAVGSYLCGSLTNGTTTDLGIQPVQVSSTVNNALAGLTLATYGASVTSALPAVHKIKGTLIATGTGTLAFAFAQSSSGVNTANLGVGSHMKVTQLS